MFFPGKKVEVSFEKEYPRDVWFPATIIECSSSGSFLVKYHRPGIKELSAFDKVNVDHDHIRPCPPHLGDKKFVFLEKVDAFYNFGWWSGVIIEELTDNRYIVYIKHANKQKEVTNSELRRHVEWKGGKWFSSLQDICCNNSEDAKLKFLHNNSIAMKSVPRSLNLMGNKTEQKTPVEKRSNVLQQLSKKRNQIHQDVDNTHLLPSKKLKEMHDSHPLCDLKASHSVAPNGVSFSSHQEQRINKESLDKSKTNSHIMEARRKHRQDGEPNLKKVEPVRKRGRPAKTKTENLQGSVEEAVNNSEGKTSEDRAKKDYQMNATDSEILKKNPASTEIKGTQSDDIKGEMTPDISVENNPVVKETNIRKSKRVEKAKSKTLSTSVQGNLGKSTEEKAKVVVEKESLPDECKTIVIGLESSGNKGGSRADESILVPVDTSLKRSRDQEKQLNVLTKPGSLSNKEKNDIEGGGATSQKRGRGRPPKSLAKNSDMTTPVKQQHGEVSSSKKIVVQDKRAHGHEDSLDPVKDLAVHDVARVNQKKVSPTTKQMPLSRKGELAKGKVTRASSKQPKKHSVKGKRGGQRTISLNGKVSTQDSQDVFKDELHEGLKKALVISELEMTVDKLPTIESDDQPLLTWFEGRQSPTNVDSSGTNEVAVVDQSSETNAIHGEISLPFVKNIALWKAIESMDVFRKIPQNPHFRPLRACKENSREGLAIGHMVTFSGIVEKISKLQIDISRSGIEDCSEILVELESHGFDVKAVRSRLTALLSIKNKQEELQTKSNELQTRITEKIVEKTKVDREIEEIDKKIKELLKKRDLALLKKEKSCLEIVEMESSWGRINEGIQSVQDEFHGLAAAPW